MLFRWILGLPFAAVITAALFLLMSGLIEKPVEVGDAKPPPDLTITAKIIETKPGNHQTPPAKIKETQPPIEVQRTGPSKIPGPIIDRPKPGPEGSLGSKTGRNIAPTITVAPPYPEQCRSKGVEGIVVVQFDVTPEGNVVNARVIQTPDRCFNRTVINTVSKWRYAPNFEDGRPVMRRGVIHQFNFQLQD